jgi:hypothetical protein
MAKRFEITEVDVEKAQAAMDFMADYVQKHPEEILKAENAAKDALMGIVLTAVATGLVPNAMPITTEFRDKIYMAFNIGYYQGKYGN